MRNECSGRAWKEGGAKYCIGQNSPMFGRSDDISVGGLDGGLSAMKRVLATMKRKGPGVRLLDITKLSLLRKDAHPSLYGLPGRTDCSHWCLPGIPDFWNQILFAFIISWSIITLHQWFNRINCKNCDNFMFVSYMFNIYRVTVCFFALICWVVVIS